MLKWLKKKKKKNLHKFNKKDECEYVDDFEQVKDDKDCQTKERLAEDQKAKEPVVFRGRINHPERYRVAQIGDRSHTFHPLML